MSLPENQIERLLTTQEVAQVTGMSMSWFEHRRWLGDGAGPRYVRIGRSVRYPATEFQKWLEKSIH